jgi:hypothetical protein
MMQVRHASVCRPDVPRDGAWIVSRTAGLVSKSVYQRRPVRYAYVLTDKGTALGAG